LKAKEKKKALNPFSAVGKQKSKLIETLHEKEDDTVLWNPEYAAPLAESGAAQVAKTGPAAKARLHLFHTMYWLGYVFEYDVLVETGISSCRQGNCKCRGSRFYCQGS
jgi:hypothetical protein